MRSISIMSRLEKHDRLALKSDIAPAVTLLKSIETTHLDFLLVFMEEFSRILLAGVYKNIDLLRQIGTSHCAKAGEFMLDSFLNI